MDLLRYMPGVAFNQSGAAGGVTSLFLRGGNSNMTLVQIDGVPVNSFGGALRFRPHSRRSGRPHRGDPRRAVGGLRVATPTPA